MPSIVNTAGRQRMLGQRIVKSYVQLAQHVHAEQARAQVAESMREFERQLAALAGSSQAVTRETLDAMALCWQEFRRFALARPSHEGVLALRESGEQLLLAAERHTAAVAAQQGFASAHAVNVAGRLRMLAQRVALCYLLELRDELNRSCAAFAAGLRDLRERSARAELRWVGELWNELTALVAEDSDHREEVVQAADRLVERIEQLVALYERQS